MARPNTRNPQRPIPARRHARIFMLAALLLGASTLPVLAQAPQRAAAAAARGDLRAAQIEWRNAVRQDPNSVTSRVALASISLELGDSEAAEREIRAALQRGLDPTTGNALLIRAFMTNGRYSELLTSFPQPQTDPGGLIASGRAMAHLGLAQQEPARESVQLALRLAPEGAEPQLAAAALALAEGNRVAAEAAVDLVLARDPRLVEALVRKGTLLFDRREPREAITYLDRAIGLAPGHVYALLRRGEMRMMLNEFDLSRRDIDAALAVQPNNSAGYFLRAMLATQTMDWAGADRSLQRIGAVIGNFPTGYLLLASVKRGLGQTEQAMDAARRHVARSPDDPRGPRLLAALELEANRPRDAATTLTDLAARGNADPGSLDTLGRLHSAAGRRHEAVAAFQAAAALAPRDAAILSRLAAARLAVGDVPGTVQAANAALLIDPALEGAQEMLAFAALYRGDTAAVMATVDRLMPEARQSEVLGVLRASVYMMRIDLAQAKSNFRAVLRDHPNSLAARLGLVRVNLIEGDLPEVERLLGETLRLDPANAEAIGQLVNASLPPSPRSAEAQRVLEAAQAAAPEQPALALALAHVLVRNGRGARAVELLSAEPLARQTNATFAMARAEAQASVGNWPAAEAASRAALSEVPGSVAARRQLAVHMGRAGETRGAEIVLEQGLRDRPGDPILLQTLMAMIRDARGLDAALETADRLRRDPRAQPAGGALRGDLLMAAQRPADAAIAYADVQTSLPSSQVAQRLAAAQRAAGQTAEAMATLRAWLDREPADDVAALMLSNLEIETGRLAEAEQHLEAILARQSDNVMVLNNLAWLLARQDTDARMQRARNLAERAYFLVPGAETADTLGWILTRAGQPGTALLLLRHSARAQGGGPPNPGSAYRLAYALNATGAREEALTVLAPALEGSVQPFAERTEATRLLADLRGRR